MSCDDLCELWKHDVNVIEEEEKKAKESVTKKPIITVKRSTLYRQWNRLAPQECTEGVYTNNTNNTNINNNDNDDKVDNDNK